MSVFLLSVIIPTRNRAHLLKGTLESITKQSFPKESLEVIVNDNGSIDDTKSVVESFMGVLPNLVYHYDPTPGLHVGRHNGYKLAKSDILVYADDDIVAVPTWLESVWNSFKDERVVLVGGKDLPKFEVDPPQWVLDRWNNSIVPEGKVMAELSLVDLGDTKKEINPYFVFGCNFSIRRSVLDATKGFHPDGMPFEIIQYRGDGETAVSRYIMDNHLITIYDPGATVYHMVTKGRMTTDYFRRRAYCQGVEMSYIDHRGGTTQYDEDSKGIKHQIGNFLRLLKMNKLDRGVFLSRIQGYRFHKKMYDCDPAIREWVHRESYID